MMYIYINIIIEFVQQFLIIYLSILMNKPLTMFLQVIIFGLVLLKADSASTIPVFAQNTNFLAGIHSFVPSTINPYDQTANVPYGRSLNSSFLSDPAIGIMELMISANQPYLYFVITPFNKTTLGFIVRITLFHYNNQMNLKFNYLVAEQNYNNRLCFANFRIMNPQLASTIPASLGNIAFYVDISQECPNVTLNVSSSNLISYYLNSVISNSSNTNKPYHIVPLITVNNQTFLRVVISKNQRIQIFQIRFSVIIIDLTAVSAQNNNLYYFESNIINAVSTTTNFPTTHSNYVSNNHLLGLRRFYFLSTTDIFQYTINRGAASQLIITTSSYDTIQMSQFYTAKKNCPSPYNFFKESDSRCYDTCPNGYYANGTQCLACSLQCATCNSFNVCINCSVNSFQNLTGCFLCNTFITNCSLCISSQICTSCSSGYLSPLDHKCYDNCQGRMFNNMSIVGGGNICSDCHPYCLTCNGSLQNQCTSCSETSDNRILVNNSCIAAPTYYDNSTRVALKCRIPCLNCSNQTYCLSCTDGYYLSFNHTCQSCSYTLFGCLSCSNNSTCLTCNSGYVLDNITNTCSCNHSNCAQCEGIPSKCISCQIGYELIDGKCQPKCGDGILVFPQECDYKYVVDGCTKDCVTMNQYNCYGVAFGNITLSECKFIGVLKLEKVKIVKDYNGNSINMILRTNKNLNSLGNISQILGINLTTKFTALYNKQSGIISISIDYDKNLEEIPFSIKFSPNNVSIFSLANTNQLQGVFQSENNLGLYYYPPQAYSTFKFIQILSSTAILFAWLVMIASLLSYKLIGIQLMAIFQLAFFGLLTISSLNPPMSGLLRINLANGYNQIPFQNNNKVNEKQLQGVFLFPHFLSNDNITALLFVVPVLIGLILKVKIRYTDDLFYQGIYQKASKLARGEWAFSGLMFGAYLFSVSLMVQFIYGFKQLNGIISYLSIILSIVMLFSYIFYFLYLIKEPELFRIFTQSFNKQSVLSTRYYNFLMIERLFTSVFMIALMKTNYALAIPILMLVLQVIFVIIKKPYLHQYHNIRVILNLTITLIIMSMYLYFKIMSPTINQSQFATIMPLIIVILLLIAAIYNLGFTIMELKRLRRNEQMNYIKQNTQETAKLKSLRQMAGMEMKMIDQNYQVKQNKTLSFPTNEIQLEKIRKTNKDNYQKNSKMYRKKNQKKINQISQQNRGYRVDQVMVIYQNL